MEINTTLDTVDKNQIVQASTEILRAELVRAISITARGLAYLAVVWAELERRGEDLSDLRTGLALYLPQIASGRLDPEAVVHFAGQKTVLKFIATLSREEQQRLSKGANVQIIDVTEEGEIVEKFLPARALTAAQATQVFDDGRIRSVAEQREQFDNQLLRLKNSSRRRQPKIHFDRKINSYIIDRHKIKLVDLIAVTDPLDRVVISELFSGKTDHL